jgi:hypothetical protein
MADEAGIAAAVAPNQQTNRKAVAFGRKGLLTDRQGRQFRTLVRLVQRQGIRSDTNEIRQ